MAKAGAKTKKAAAKSVAAPADEPVIESFKGFDLNLQCRGFQYEIGASYEHAGDVKICATGFHACEHPLDVFGYYPPATSRYALVRQSGKIARESGDTKIASARIVIEAELRLSDMIERAVKWVISRAKSEKGSQATGDSGAAMACGYAGRAQGADGCALFLVHRDDEWEITHAWAGIVGRDGIKPMTWYTLGADGKPQEVVE